MTQSPLLTLSSICIKSKEATPLLNQVHLRLDSGKCIVIEGESGCGKSVLLKIAAGLIEPESGTVTCETQRVGMIFQKGALFSSYSAEENITLLMRESGVSESDSKKSAYSWLNAVGLSGFENYLPDELSGGMQKRLAIARALALKPDLLLCDEPTAGLDPITAERIVELLKKIQTESNLSLLCILNDAGRARAIADERYSLDKGKLVPC